MARPNKKMAEIIRYRNLLMREACAMGFTQSEVAVMFRVPRNTVHMAVKKSDP